MELNEKINALIAKTGVTETEAREALEKNSGDILDAVLMLEREGKTTAKKEIEEEQTQEQATEEEPVEKLEGDVVNQDGTKAGNTSEKAARFADSAKRLAIALLKQMFIVERKGEEILSVPVLVLIIAIIAGFGIIVPLLIVGLFLGCHYSVTGAKTMTFDVNEISKKASEYAEDIKNEFAGKH